MIFFLNHFIFLKEKFQFREALKFLITQLEWFRKQKEVEGYWFEHLSISFEDTRHSFSL